MKGVQPAVFFFVLLIFGEYSMPEHVLNSREWLTKK